MSTYRARIMTEHENEVPRYRDCCSTGHRTPEVAAACGSVALRRYLPNHRRARGGAPLRCGYEVEAR